MRIALDQIDHNPAPARRGDPARPDPDFAAVIAAQGVLQPILVRQDGNRYVVVKGDRRLAAARAAGLTEIPVHIETGLVGAHALAANVSATLARAPLRVTEQWRALSRLTDEGMPPGTAAISLGLDPRVAAQMERLGRLHPELLDAYTVLESWVADDPDTFGLPDWSDLGVIAAAPPDDQIAAAHACGYPEDVDWGLLADRLCRRATRIPRARAIFNPADMAWDEDLFAQPGTPDQFTTADTEGFLARQRATLIMIAEKSKGRIVLGPVPRGWAVDAYGQDTPTVLAKTDKRTIYAVVIDTGHQLGLVQWRIARPNDAPAVKPSLTPDPAGDEEDDDTASNDEGGDGRHGDEDDDEAPTPSAPATPAPPLTKAGQALLAEARTTALRNALRAPDRAYSYDDLLAMLLVALSAKTVKIKAGHDTYASSVDMRDLAARLVGPDGHLRTDDPGVNLGALAQEAIARMLALPKPDDQRHGYAEGYTDPVPEWIGAMVAAHAHLPRLDTEPFLAQVTGSEIKAWAKSEGIKGSKVTELRARMTNHAPGWRPAWTQFGAPGPQAKGQGA